MKKFKTIWIGLAVIFAATAVSCKNNSWDFPDYDYTTAYFGYQYPVRTIVLGEDIYDTTLDNEHKCQIMGIMGGVRSNDTERILHVAIDKTLCDGIAFGSEDGAVTGPLKVMPDNYYSLPSDMTIRIPKGKPSGGIEVQLSDAFFNDPDAIKNTYVIPMRITSAEKIDSVLSGRSTLANPNIHVATDWVTAPKNYILYCVKYINPWHASYLRRGVDVGTGKNGNSSLDVQIVRHAKYIEKNEVCHTKTRSMKEIELSLATKNKANVDLPYTLVIAFDEQENCTVKAIENANYTITGSGKFVKDGDKNSWGSEDRDALYLDYTIDFETTTYAIKDTLALRDRGIVLETFNPIVTK